MGLWFANGGFEMFLPSFYRLLPSFFFFFFFFRKVFHWSVVQPFGEMAGPR